MERVDKLCKEAVLLEPGVAQSAKAYETQAHGCLLWDLVSEAHGSWLAPRVVAQSSPASRVCERGSKQQRLNTFWPTASETEQAGVEVSMASIAVIVSPFRNGLAWIRED
mgnify:CR=1 FL=1